MTETGQGQSPPGQTTEQQPAHVTLPAKTAFENADNKFGDSFWNTFIDPADYTSVVPPPRWSEHMSNVEYKPEVTEQGEYTTDFTTQLDTYLNAMNAAINTSASRTVYMDSNIALTDGTAKLGDATGPHVIPNLYEAIVGLRDVSQEIDERVHSIEMGNENSTADKGLYVSHASNKFTITAGNGFSEGIIDNKATDAVTTAILNFTASSIEFTVDAMKEDGKTKESRTYNLAAIIEAIQELNRRTMFMDTDAPFLSGVHFADVNEDVVISAAMHARTPDHLPAAREPAKKPVNNGGGNGDVNGDGEDNGDVPKEE